MGALNSAPQDGLEIDMTTFLEWNMTDVRDAHARAFATVRPRQVNGRRVMLGTRSQFCEVFIGPGMVAPKGRPSLPISVFSAFVDPDMSVPDGPDYADFLELLLIMALFCNGTPDAQTGLCFKIFDADGSGLINKEEMTGFLLTLATATWRVGLMPEPPDAAHVASLADDMMRAADEDGSQALNASEFMDWAKRNVDSQRLLQTMQSAKTIVRHTSDGSMTSFDPGSATDIETDFPDEKSRIIAQQRHKVKQGITAQRALDWLAAHTKFSMRDLRRLRRRFNAAANGAPLTRAQFVTLLTSEYPSIAGKDVTRLFNAFDKDGNGTIDFREFVTGVSALTHGKLEDKLEFLFEVYDLNGDGYLSVQELAKYATNATSDLQDSAKFARDMIAELDINKDGVISREEFVEALSKDTVLMECFARSLLSGNSIPSREVRGNVRLLQAAGGIDFDLRLLREVWQRCGRQSSGGLNRHQFRQFMMDEFKVPGECSELLNRLFDLFDTDRSGFVAWRELFTGLSQACAGTVADKAALYFKLFDTDDSGIMERAEIEHMLYATQRVAQEHAGSVKSMLELLDADGDGEVTLQEFQSAVKKNPQLLNVFGKMFGNNHTRPMEQTLFNSLHKDQVAHSVGTATGDLLHAVRLRAAAGGNAAVAKFASNIRAAVDVDFEVRSQVRRLPLHTAAELVLALQRRELAGGLLSPQLSPRKPQPPPESEADAATRKQELMTKLRAGMLGARMAVRLRRQQYARAVSSLAAREHGRQLQDDLAERLHTMRQDVKEASLATVKLSARLRSTQGKAAVPVQTSRRQPHPQSALVTLEELDAQADALVEDGDDDMSPNAAAPEASWPGMGSKSSRRISPRSIRIAAANMVSTTSLSTAAASPPIVLVPREESDHVSGSLVPSPPPPNAKSRRPRAQHLTSTRTQGDMATLLGADADAPQSPTVGFPSPSHAQSAASLQPLATKESLPRIATSTNAANNSSMVNVLRSARALPATARRQAAPRPVARGVLLR